MRRVSPSGFLIMQPQMPGLEKTLSHLQSGDTLVVWKLDRLGRAVKGLVDLVTELEGEKVNFKSLTEGIDTTSSAGRFFFHVMSSLAQMERELAIERTRAGLAAAKQLGRAGGRRRIADLKIETAYGPVPRSVDHQFAASPEGFRAKYKIVPGQILTKDIVMSR